MFFRHLTATDRSQEVIQPQIPLRLPCYDLTLLAKFRFESGTYVRTLTHTSLGWFDGRCVQGAGTYSPRHVETRLLRIPASRGWVSTLDPNFERVYEIDIPFRGSYPLSRPL